MTYIVLIRTFKHAQAVSDADQCVCWVGVW